MKIPKKRRFLSKKIVDRLTGIGPWIERREQYVGLLWEQERLFRKLQSEEDKNKKWIMKNGTSRFWP